MGIKTANAYTISRKVGQGIVLTPVALLCLLKGETTAAPDTKLNSDKPLGDQPGWVTHGQHGQMDLVENFYLEPNEGSGPPDNQDIMSGGNPLSYLKDSVSFYYPDMQAHVDSLINHLRSQSQIDTVNILFGAHIFAKISDPKQQVASMIYCMEQFFFKGDFSIPRSFSAKYRKDIPSDKFSCVMAVSLGYNKWFKGELSRFMASLDERRKQRAARDQQTKQITMEMDIFINTITVEKLKDSNIRIFITTAEEVYRLCGDFISPHFQTLIDATHQLNAINQ